jgi:hypothetical protein
MKSIIVIASQMNYEHATHGHVLQSTLAVMAAAIEGLPNDSDMELRVIDEMVSVISHLLYGLDTCKEDPVLVKRYLNQASAICRLTRNYLRKG